MPSLSWSNKIADQDKADWDILHETKEGPLEAEVDTSNLLEQKSHLSLIKVERFEGFASLVQVGLGEF